MKAADEIKRFFKNAAIETNPTKDREVLEQVLEACEGAMGTERVVEGSVWMMRSPITKVAAVAVIIIAIFIGINQFGSSIDGSSVAWAQQSLQALEKVEAIVYRQTAVRVRDYGQDDMGGGWETRYYAINAYRRDIYDKNGEITNTQWMLPNGKSNIKHEVSFKYRCYWDETKKHKSYYDGLMTHLRRYISFLDRASRIPGREFFDGKECVGFEISPGEYGDFTVTQPTYIWFDPETKLPARIERRGIQTEYDPSMKLTLIHDQFNYYAEVPANMFTPEIPQGFVNAHSDEIIARNKGELIYADVPQELCDEIVSALKEVQSAIYQGHLERTTADGDIHTYGPSDVYLARDAWREDSSKWETPQKKKWYRIEKENPDVTSVEFNERNFKLIETIVNFTNKTYSVATYEETSRHRHPMGRILFLASLVNQADRILENIEIEGIECFGVEVSAIKYGNNSPNDKHRMWFDMETKLPVRMEFEYWQPDGKSKSVRIRDYFQWDPELDKETFVPIIPEDFKLVHTSEK